MSAGSVNYRRGIRASVRGYWTGSLDYNQFFDAMVSIIRRGVTVAWHEGAKECGISPSELTPEEKMALQQAIAHETNYISDFAAVIEAGSKAEGGNMGPLMVKAELWINRYRAISNQAKIPACGDKKLLWRLGATEKHCVDCNRLDGKIKRASQWQRANIETQSPDLSCGGWRCKCALTVTDEPLSKGPLPRLVGPG